MARRYDCGDFAVKEFYSERDLDEIGLYSKPHRERLIKAGKFPAPIKFGGRGSKRFYPREAIDAIKAGKREADAS
jgi:predicted DNA-binding transcriptional regulator AlpA